MKGEAFFIGREGCVAVMVPSVVHIHSVRIIATFVDVLMSFGFVDVDLSESVNIFGIVEVCTYKAAQFLFVFARQTWI